MELSLSKPRRIETPRRRLVVPSAVAEATSAALKKFRKGRRRHEGLVLWAGRTMPADTYVLASIVPESEHGPGFVRVREPAVGAASALARSRRLSIVAQVHSHPSAWVDHSDDDEMVLMPFDGMFSLVVGCNGDAPIATDETTGVHERQGDRWVRVRATDALILVPAVMSDD